MTQLTARLEELKKICESATEGPWIKQEICAYGNDIDSPAGWIIDSNNVNVGTRQADLNADFIEESRTAMPKLIEALEVAIRQRNIALHAAYMTGSEAFNTAKMNYDSEIEAILCEQGGGV